MALIRSFNQTNLDLEDNQPLGGPINPHIGLPNTPATYYSVAVTRVNGGSNASPLAYGGNSVYGRPDFIFNQTNLDLENSLPQGGPINDLTSRFLHLSLPNNRNTWYSQNRNRWS